jgi:membrane-bound lytic murein transglycosylase B|tara:strand:+ start:811 stop:1791 length:981 start_codon:yes stop_codon:yes gene_type:complete
MKYILIFIYFTIFFISKTVLANNNENFNVWLNDFKLKAKQHGISQETIDNSLSNINLIPRVIELDRKQPEFTLTLNQYLNKVVSKNRIEKGIKKIRENWELLEEISNKYNVQPRYIVALWGIETDYGRISGGFPVIASLVTLSYDGRRSRYFTKELLNALKIIDDGHIDSNSMMGSWAGAMGQTQFMPSSFLSYAQDYNNDGKKDIWNSKDDALASAANYLAKLKWNNNETWGREVSVSEEFNIDPNLLTLKNEKSLLYWHKQGVKKLNGSDLPKNDLQASLIMIQSKNNYRYFIVYKNFKRILRWNTSNYFAIAVGKLSDAISIN